MWNILLIYISLITKEVSFFLTDYLPFGCLLFNCLPIIPLGYLFFFFFFLIDLYGIFIVCCWGREGFVLCGHSETLAPSSPRPHHFIGPWSLPPYPLHLLLARRWRKRDMMWEEEGHVGSFIELRTGSTVNQWLLPTFQPDAGYVVLRKYKWG